MSWVWWYNVAGSAGRVAVRGVWSSGGGLMADVDALDMAYRVFARAAVRQVDPAVARRCRRLARRLRTALVLEKAARKRAGL